MTRQLENHLARVGFPDLNGAIVAAGSNPFAVGTKGNPTAADAFAMATKGEQLLAGGCVPNTRPLVDWRWPGVCHPG